MRKSIRFLAALAALIIAYLACRGGSAPESTPQPVSSGVTMPPPTPKTTGTRRDAPYPVGQAVDIGGMTLAVVWVKRPANDIVAEGNIFNPTPEADQEYILVDVRIECKRDSNEKCTFSTYELKTVGANGQIHDQAFAAGIPNELEPTSELFGGGAVEGALVFLATPNDTTTVLMYEPLLLGEPLYFALQ